jgi:hypothetical protein
MRISGATTTARPLTSDPTSTSICIEATLTISICCICHTWAEEGALPTPAEKVVGPLQATTPLPVGEGCKDTT